jgi:hypothetical protein
VILLRRSCGAEGLSDITKRCDEISGLLSHPSEFLCGGNGRWCPTIGGLAEYRFQARANILRRAEYDLLEDDRFIFVEENSVFDVPTNSAGKNYFFKVPPFFH